MIWLLIIIVILLILQRIIEHFFNKYDKFDKEQNIDEKIDLSKYSSNGYLMTQTELIFYRELKKITDKLELSIFPQVNLERIINVIDKNMPDRNRIKSRSIDYTIVNNKNCKIICCIELDDYTHNREKTKKQDEFKDNIFKQVNIPLHRIKVNNYYNLDELENKIKESIKPPTSI